MRPLLIFFCLTSILFSCSNRKEFKAEDFKKQQEEYEKKKLEINKQKGEFYEANKGRLMSILNVIDKVKDSDTQFNDTETDTTYYKGDVLMQPVNFGIRMSGRGGSQGTSDEAVNIVFVDKLNSEEAHPLFNDPFKVIRSCRDQQLDFECMKIKQENLQSLLNVKYAFVTEELLYIEPKLRTDEFDGGVYISTITCVDVLTSEPIYSFQVTATSSDEIQVNTRFGQTAERKIQQDFKSNINKGILEACQAHFNLPDDIKFVQTLF